MICKKVNGTDEKHQHGTTESKYKPNPENEREQTTINPCCESRQPAARKKIPEPMVRG
jgi:hypothetical protein